MRRLILVAFSLALAAAFLVGEPATVGHAQEAAADDAENADEGDPTEPREEASEGPFADSTRRLATILGSMHFLRTLCAEDEPSVWREDMTALLKAQSPSDPDRRRLIASFNNGYRSYETTYRDCTPAARIAYNRYQREGLTLSRDLLNRYGN